MVVVTQKKTVKEIVNNVINVMIAEHGGVVKKIKIVIGYNLLITNTLQDVRHLMI